MPGIAKNTTRESPDLGYGATVAQQQADSHTDLLAKQAKARTMRAQKQAQEAEEARERQRVHHESNRANVEFMEQYFQCFGPLNALVALEKFKRTACIEFNELYVQRFGRAANKEAREARKAHFNEQFAAYLAQNHQEQVGAYEKTALDGVYAVYADEFPARADPEHFQAYYQNAKRAHQMCREATLPPKFSVAHYVRLFRRMDDQEFASLLRTGENGSPNMIEGAKIVYKERKEELVLVPRNKPISRAPMQPRAEE